MKDSLLKLKCIVWFAWKKNLYKGKGIYMYLYLLQIKEQNIQEIDTYDVVDKIFPSTSGNTEAQLKDFCSSRATHPWVVLN